jgi:ATP-binding cassette, subfamily F, member 3
VFPGQRIGILGANGQGKSTLVKTLARELAPLAGRVSEGKGLAIGYFAQQEMDVLRADDGPLAHMVRLARELTPQAKEQELRNFLGRFRFSGDMVAQPVGTLSGGEKARLVLAMIVWQRPNLLLLDEPTNHLDLDTREALSIALNEFEGTVLLVSHDRALLREVCDEFWLVSRGGVAPWDGDLDDYQRWLLEQSREAQRALKTAAPVTEAASTAATANRRDERRAQAAVRQKLADEARPLKRELAKVDAQLGGITSERDALLAAMAQQDVPAAERAEQGRRLKQLEEDLAHAENRWLELSEAIEHMLAQG